MTNITTTRLSGHRTLVQGTDAFGNHGQVVLDSHQWDELNARAKHSELIENFDDAVTAFYAPLVAAAEAVQAKLSTNVDPAFTVILDEGEAPSQGRPAEVVELTQHSAILRLIEAGSTDRLIWVGDDLEILEYNEDTANTVAFEYAEKEGEGETPESVDVPQHIADKFNLNGETPVHDSIVDTSEPTA